MAIVYRAHDESLGRTVALKVLQGHPTDAAAAQRERSEVALLASLSHPALVTLFDAAEYTVGGEQRTCLIMEYVDGPTLEARISQRPIGRADVVAMAIDLAEALDVVHSRGVVHRDIKPANILLGASRLEGREYAARLADFGIAYLIDSTRITATGTLIGTAAYVSPEQARGDAPGPASDIYSLGLVLLESLTGKREFTGSLVETVAARLSRDPSIPDGVDDEWRALLSAMTAQMPIDRPSALEIALAARSIQANQHIATAPTVPFASATDAPTENLVGTGQPEATLAATRLFATPQPETAQLETALPETSPPDPALPETQVLGAAMAQDNATTDTKASRTRWPWILAVVAIAIALGGLVSMLGRDQGTETTPTPVPTLPTLDDPLGTHLGDLLEAVSP